MKRRVILQWIALAIVGGGCERRRRRKRAHPPTPPAEPPVKEEEPEFVPDDAVTLGDLSALQRTEDRVLYLLPFEPEQQGSGDGEPKLSWAVAWGQGKSFGVWEELPREGELQVIFFRRLYKSEKRRSPGVIPTVIAYDDRIGLEDLGIRSQILQLAGGRQRKKLFDASLVPMKQLGVEVPKDVKRAKRR